jgi:integrase
MGKWKAFNVGDYRLGRLDGEAVAVWYDGEPRRRHRYRLGVATETEGRAALARFARQNDSLAALQTQKVADIWDAYIKDRERDGKGMQIFKHNWKALAPTFGALVTTDVTEDLCRAYAVERFGIGRAPATVNTELSRLSQAIKWAHDRGLIVARPKVWIPSAGRPRSRVLTETEFLAILDGCRQPHVRLFAILLLCTGGRHTAVCELTWDRVDFDQGEIDLRTPGTVDPMSKRHRKGRAIVAMNALARAALTEAKAGALTDRVVEQHGKGLKTVKEGFKAACERAGVDGVSPHTLRHTGASWAWSSMPAQLVARFLGHSNTKTTEAVYSHSSAEQTRGVADVVNLKIVRK